MMKLGCFLEGTGHHVAAWRDPDVDPHGRQSLAQYLNSARTAERGKFDLLFMADKEYEGKTLRENLGLPIPQNRWAMERVQKSAG